MLFLSKDCEFVVFNGFIFGVCVRFVVEMFCDVVVDIFSGVVEEFERKCVWLIVKVGCINVWLRVGML